MRNGPFVDLSDIISVCVIRSPSSSNHLSAAAGYGVTRLDYGGEAEGMATRCNLRLSDVHATAEIVGREFKKLTDRFGMDCVSLLVPPVVHALEWLELYVEHCQHLHTTVSELEMENDTLQYEKEQKAMLTAKNENLTVTIRELQKENKCLLMEMDDLHYKNQELSSQLQNGRTIVEKPRAKSQNSESVAEEIFSEDLGHSSSPPSPPPHSPNRVVHLSQIYPSPPGHQSPKFTPSPPPILPVSLLSSVTDTIPTPTQILPHSHTVTSPLALHSPESLDQVFPSSPRSNIRPFNQRRSPYTPPTARAHPDTQSVGRSVSLSDMARVRTQSQITRHPQEEDMFEKFRVTRRLSKVESDLETTTQQLGDLQRSRERLIDENRRLKTQVEKLKAEVSLESIVTKSKGRPAEEETPRYYKKDVMQILTERNQLKEQLHTLQEEVDQLRDLMRKTATGTRARSAIGSLMNGAATIAGGERVKRRKNNVRDILTESIDLGSYRNIQAHLNNASKHCV